MSRCSRKVDDLVERDNGVASSSFSIGSLRLSLPAMGNHSEGSCQIQSEPSWVIENAW